MGTNDENTINPAKIRIDSNSRIVKLEVGFFMSRTNKNSNIPNTKSKIRK